MRLVFLLAIVYAAAVLETSLAGAISVGHVAPDLLALVAVIWLLLVPGRRAFLGAGVIGLAADLISPGRVGLGVASFLLVGYALTWLRTKFRCRHILWQVPAVYAATTVLAVSLGAGRWLLGETVVPLSTLLPRAAGVGIYTTGVSLPLLMIIGWLREPFHARRSRLADF